MSDEILSFVVKKTDNRLISTHVDSFGSLNRGSSLLLFICPGIQSANFVIGQKSQNSQPHICMQILNESTNCTQCLRVYLTITHE